MKKFLLTIPVLAILTGCGLYGKYERPKDLKIDNLYGAELASTDTSSFGDMKWRDVFTDSKLQHLIELGLKNNTDLQSAQWKIKEAEASYTLAKWGYAPSFSLTPQGTLSSFDGSKASKVYTAPVSASWEIAIFGRLTNAKRQAKAALLQSREYEQAVQTQLISTIANYYYTLLMLSSQYETTKETIGKWNEYLEVLIALKEAGMANQAAVAQTKANCLSIETSLVDLGVQIKSAENSLSALLGETPTTFELGNIFNQNMPSELSVGIPIQMLSNRPDVRAAEFALEQAFYATNQARSKCYPSIIINGSAGFTNSVGGIILNPGKLILSAAGSLTQPLLNTGVRTNLKISKAQQEVVKLAFQQTLLNAGVEVNNSISIWEAAKMKADLRRQQIESLEVALESTQLLMQHGSTTYLEVLTAQQGLLAAQLSYVSDKYSEIQGIISLYHSLGGGRN